MSGYLVLAIVGLFCMTIAYQTQQIQKILDAWRAERKDFIDRLQAKDLRELKQAQAIEKPRETRIVSKRKNDERIAEELRKMEGQE